MNALHTTPLEAATLLIALWILVCVPVYAAAGIWVYRKRRRVRAAFARVLEIVREGV